jgi:hypothetical protein
MEEVMTIVRQLKDGSGQAAELTLPRMNCLLGMVGLAANIGTLFDAKRNLQIAVDSAAIGAAELSYGHMTAASDAAAESGVFIGVTDGTVYANSLPKVVGAYAGLSGDYAEVIVSQSEPTFYMKIFHIASQSVAPIAVAYNGSSGGRCVCVLSPNAADLQGSFDVSAPRCGFQVNSNATDALQFTEGGGSLTAWWAALAGRPGRARMRTPTVRWLSMPKRSAGERTASACRSCRRGTLPRRTGRVHDRGGWTGNL